MRREIRLFLTRPRMTAARIKELDERAQALRESMLPGGISYEKDRVQGTKSDPMLRFAEKIDKLTNEIERLKKRYYEEVSDIENAIDAVDEPIERRILTMRWIRGMSPAEIALKLGYAESSVHRIHRLGAKQIIVPQKDDSE